MKTARGERLYLCDGSLQCFSTQRPSAVAFSSSESEHAPVPLQGGWRDSIRLRVALP